MYLHYIEHFIEWISKNDLKKRSQQPVHHPKHPKHHIHSANTQKKTVSQQ